MSHKCFKALSLVFSSWVLSGAIGLSAVGAETQLQPVTSVEVKVTQTGVFPPQVQVHPGTIAFFIKDMTSLPLPTFIVDADQIKQNGQTHVKTLQGSSGKPSVGMFVNLTAGTYYIWEASHSAYEFDRPAWPTSII